MTEVTIIDSALALRTKVDILAWIGILPPSHSVLAKMEADLMHKALTDDTCPEDIKDEARKHIPKVHAEMDQGIDIILKKLDSDACVKCGKCDDLSDILHMLRNGIDIHTIIPKIQEHYGDVAAIHGRGMPGEPGEGYPAQPPIVGVASDRLGIDQLIGRLLERDPIHTDHSGSMGPRSMNPIKVLLESLFGPPIDKDKLI